MSTAKVSSAATKGSAITSAAELPTAKRVVIKIGSSSLTTVAGGIRAKQALSPQMTSAVPKSQSKQETAISKPNA